MNSPSAGKPILSPLGRALPEALRKAHGAASGFEANADSTVDFVVHGNGPRARQVRRVTNEVAAAGYDATLVSAPRRTSVFGKRSPTPPIYSENWGIVRATPRRPSRGASPRARKAKRKEPDREGDVDPDDCGIVGRDVGFGRLVGARALPEVGVGYEERIDSVTGGRVRRPVFPRLLAYFVRRDSVVTFDDTDGRPMQVEMTEDGRAKMEGRRA